MPSQQPIAGFRVRFARLKSGYWALRNRSLTSQNEFPTGTPLQVKQVSHSKGLFDLKVRPGGYMVQVQARGHRPSTPFHVWARPTHRKLRPLYRVLRSGRSALLGRVVRKGSDEPVSGVLVTAVPTDASLGWRRLQQSNKAPTSSRMTYTGADGSFVLGGLPAGSYGLLLRAKGYAPWKRAGLGLADGEHKDLGEIGLDGRTASLSGQVLNGQNQPQHKAIVSVYSRGAHGVFQKIVHTGAEGRYAFHSIPAGWVYLRARLKWGFMAPHKAHRLKLKGGERRRFDFRFGQGGLKLQGRLFGTQGQPIAGAKVMARTWVHKPKSHMSSGFSTTNSQGEYAIAGLSPGRHNVYVEVKGVRSVSGIADVKDPVNTHDIRLKGGSLRVRLLDALTHKAPNIGVWVLLRWRQEKKWQQLWKWSRPGAPAQFHHLPDVPLELHAQSRAYAKEVRRGLHAQVGTPAEVVIRLSPQGRLLLRLQTPGAKLPVHIGAQLLLRGKYTWVHSQPTPSGELLVRGLPQGPVQLRIHARGYRQLELQAQVPTAGIGRATFSLTRK